MVATQKPLNVLRGTWNILHKDEDKRYARKPQNHIIHASESTRLHTSSFSLPAGGLHTNYTHQSAHDLWIYARTKKLNNIFSSLLLDFM